MYLYQWASTEFSLGRKIRPVKLVSQVNWSKSLAFYMLLLLLLFVVVVVVTAAAAAAAIAIAIAVVCY